MKFLKRLWLKYKLSRARNDEKICISLYYYALYSDISEQAYMEVLERYRDKIEILESEIKILEYETRIRNSTI